MCPRKGACRENLSSTIFSRTNIESDRFLPKRSSIIPIQLWHSELIWPVNIWKTERNKTIRTCGMPQSITNSTIWSVNRSEDASMCDFPSFQGPQNLSGRSVFDIAPLDGVIPAGSKKPLTVTFSPDHDSDYFSDLVRITISEQVWQLRVSWSIFSFLFP